MDSKKRIILIILMVMMFLMTGCTSWKNKTSQLTEGQKVEDFNYLYKVIEENYPYLEVNKRQNNVDWLSKKEEYLTMVKDCKNDQEFLEALGKILSELNNGHTDMLEDTTRFKWFREVYTMTDGWQHRLMLDVLNNEKALKRYEVDKDEVVEPKSQEADEKKEDLNNASTQDIIEGKIGYISIRQMLSDYKMDEDITLLDSYINKIRDYQALVIDIRGNGGGDSRYWSSYLIPKLIDKPYTASYCTFWRDGDVVNDFIRKSGVSLHGGFGEVSSLDLSVFKNLPNEVSSKFRYYDKFTTTVIPGSDSVKFRGNIYLLVDRCVYSSSEALASFAKGSGIAKLIGERTGGDGIGQDPLLQMLPNSGYVFRFSADMGVTSDGTCNEEFKTLPDYEVENPNRTEDMKDDNCIKKVLELEEIK